MCVYAEGSDSEQNLQFGDDLNRLDEYLLYHLESSLIGDIDPQNDMFNYICEKFELNIEQRYWVCFLFGCTYCGPTVFYIYNEFPDFERADLKRMERWWRGNKNKLIFQTDRLRIKTGNLFTETFSSYRELMGTQKDQKTFFEREASGCDPVDNYRIVFDVLLKNLRNFGRFSNFIYMELLHNVCGLNIAPDDLDMANALSSRNGLCYAYGFDHLIDVKLDRRKIIFLEKRFKELMEMVKEKDPKATVWSVETSLCAYKKFKRGKRYVGFYLDRQKKEILKMMDNVKEGVCWNFLLRFRQEMDSSS